MYRIASWNVNSVNARVDHVVQWLEKNEVDVLALQEIKCLDEQFPLTPFLELGYEVIVSGQKSYNGVALLSKTEAEDIVTDMPHYADPQRRIMAATIDGFRILNLYVPNGQSLGSDKYQYKLAWLDALIEFVEKEKARYPNMAIVGDFNIAPTDADVYDPKECQGNILVSEPERTALKRLLRLGFVDSFRLFKQPQDSFSWWDYRAGSLRQNKGLRIDLALLSNDLAAHCQNSDIDKTPRTWARPSDHAPVFVLLNLTGDEINNF